MVVIYGWGVFVIEVFEIENSGIDYSCVWSDFFGELS